MLKRVTWPRPRPFRGKFFTPGVNSAILDLCALFEERSFIDSAFSSRICNRKLTSWPATRADVFRRCKRHCHLQLLYIVLWRGAACVLQLSYGMISVTRCSEGLFLQLCPQSLAYIWIQDQQQSATRKLVSRMSVLSIKIADLFLLHNLPFKVCRHKHWLVKA